ncbi:MAG: carboxypeptidase regulatory-like domain-containing protein [Pyrinomonadaceae bacterium]
MFCPHSRWRATSDAARVVALLLVLTAGIAAYSSGIQATYSISGDVIMDASDGGAVTLTLSSRTPAGFTTRTLTTNGSYSFQNLPAGRTYTLTPSNRNYTLAPLSRTYANLGADVTGQDFDATIKRYQIGGLVLNGSSVFSGVTLKLTSPAPVGFTPQTIITSTSPYSFNNLPAGRTYILTPSKANYVFSPASRSFSGLSANQTLRNFLATLKSYSITGQVRAGTGGLSGVAMKLTCQTPDGFTSRRAVTGSTGVYSFVDVPVGCDYTVTPSKAAYLFTPFNRVVASINSNQTAVDFTAAPNTTYGIRGEVKAGAEAIGGVLLQLSGTRTGTTVTDELGDYSFGSLPANGNYTVSLSKENYSFTPASRAYTPLRANQTSENFEALLRTFAISGQAVIDGATITLSGSRSATTTTDNNGNYSFANLPPGGNYSVRASKQSYGFSPASRNFNGLSGNQRADFAIAASQPHVLEFIGSIQNVNYGQFWPHDVDLGHFFWEFWAMPGEDAGSRYLVSDGYGGAHALLFGFAGGGQSNYVMSGNIFDGTRNTSFESDEGPAPNEWGHYAVGWDGDAIVTYFNGVPVGKRLWRGPRRALAAPSGKLYVGGSTHQNFIGRIAQLRAYEGRNPLEVNPAAGLQFAAFTPQTIFNNNDPFWQNSTLLSSFIRPSRPVVDLSGNSHTGLIKGVLPPRFVIDPTAPTANPPAPPNGNVPVPPPTPHNARIFDSFSRVNATYALDGSGGLGSTESGAAGPQVWRYSNPSDNRTPFGILNGRAVMLANNLHAAWVPTGISSANMETRVDRRPGKWGSGISTGVVFRWRDPQNFFCAYTTGTAANTQKLYVSVFTNGTTQRLADGVAMPASWITLRVVTLKTGSINVYANSTLVYSTTSGLLTNETNAGLWNSASGQGLANRWDNFTVLEIP